MIGHIGEFLTASGFIPHGHCYLWKPGLVGLHVIADSLIALAYYSIPITLFYFVRKRQDLPFDWIFLLFASFIVACGTTHLMEVWTLWQPFYWLSGAVKSATAGVSLYTAVSLVSLLPTALALPSPAQLETANRELEREIAERKRVEATLRESEARYRAVVEDQTELITRFLPDGTLTFVNGAYCRFFGIEAQDLLGQRYEPVVFDADRAQVAQCLTQMSRDNPVVTIENRVVVEGEVRWTQWINRALFDQQGRFVEFQSVGRDISDRKQAEAALEASQRFIQKIADTAPVLLYVYDFDADRNVYTNREIAEFLGYTTENIATAQQAFLQAMQQAAAPDPETNRYDRWQAASDGEILQTEFRIQHRNGQWRYWQCQETLFARTSAGLPKQILGVAVDITDRKQTQQLQASLREKEVLLQEIHHRVKNNLQMVYSLLRLQYRRTQDQQAANILLESQNRIKSIALIHERLYRSKDFSKIDFAQYISSLVASLLSSYRVSSDAIALTTKVDGTELGINQAIPCGLIINELIANSLKYAFPSGYAGKLEVEFYTNQNGEITLIVRDNGIGIPEQIQLTATGIASHTASLGLKLVQDLVYQLKGGIAIDRTQGTTFRITFPEDMT
ncbi:sensor histidine kinase [Pantanalinema rosaneae CENA516]|uniref:sensor histidine kinase n=1 Tax=Pantanalinema rosaneae TaxID=1620701 RepID=UPI003D6F944B